MFRFSNIFIGFLFLFLNYCSISFSFFIFYRISFFFLFFLSSFPSNHSSYYLYRLPQITIIFLSYLCFRRGSLSSSSMWISVHLFIVGFHHPPCHLYASDLNTHLNLHKITGKSSYLGLIR